MGRTLSVNIEIALEPLKAFEVLVDELSLALETGGLKFLPGTKGQLSDTDAAVAQVVGWEPARRIAIHWDPTEWGGPDGAAVELLFEPVDGGTRLTLVCRDCQGATGDGTELAGWFSGEVLAPMLLAISPARLGNWVTDRRARRPSGPASRDVYRDPLYHYPNFKVILAELALREQDYLIDIGCGGGALLKEALRSGCRAAGIDHSLDMVRLATRENQKAVDDGRLTVKQATADHLPFAQGQFTCASMTGVLGFLPDALAAFRELHRVLRPGGRIVVFGSDPSLRGTPAAPEPIASRLCFYDDAQLARLALDAGFRDVRVVRRDLLPFAREAGVPQEHLALFAGNAAPFLLASTPESSQTAG
ncbi:MAG TPA: methyltransferase domain-containing protein [Tepidisphaeraceae bacterium]|nr:methyltransferase domain-containing protein [Tepidisphaeraceae bacterium]